MNTNLIHNLLNVGIALIAGLSVPEVAAVLPPEFAVKLVAFLGAAKIVINVIRDGITGLTKNQPPVQ